MAAEQKKITGRGNYTKTDLEKKINSVVEDKNKEIFELKTTIGELKSKLASFELGSVVVAGDNDIKKQILKFHAQSLNVVEILHKLTELGIEYDVDRISRVVNNVDLLDNELQLYYKKEVQAYEESVKINPNILKEALLRDNQFLINEIRKLIETTQNEEEKLKYFDRYDKFINTKTKLLSDVVIEKNDEREVSKEVENMKDEIKQNIKILNLSSERIRKI